ncbi:PAS domain S-box protein [Porifericola rhodea]|uniref:PAS domain-containing protein n=1 Tax=Porifericola rhodea TaxID=930972 RepID=UPI002666A0B8|nr:PAS domain S-box protein [Porifericola rhodea]WKN29856.1 PAS domain S-box protein [Porifericola rhodea]
MENMLRDDAASICTNYWEWNIPDNILYLSHDFKSMLGYQAEESCDILQIQDLILYPEDLERITKYWSSIQKEQYKPNMPTEIKYSHKVNSEVWASMNLSVQSWGDDQRPTKLVAHHIDITSLKQAEERLRRKNERLQSILRGANIGTWEWNMQNGDVILNERWADILGMPWVEGQVIKISDFDKMLHPEDRAIVATQLEKHLKGEEEFYKCEVRMHHMSFKWVWIEVSGKVNEWAEDGSPIWITGYVQDITERKNNALQLAYYKELLDKTNELARVGSWEMNLEFQTLTWSKVTKEIHEVDQNYRPKLSEAINFYQAGEHRDTISRAVSAAIEKGKPFDVELQIVTASNKPLWVRAIGFPEFSNGECVRIYGVFQDIDEKKNTEIKIKHSLDRNRIFVEQCPNAIAMFDHEMRYLAASQKWIEEYNLKDKKILGVCHYELFPAIREEWREIHREGLRGIHNQKDEDFFEDENGKFRWVSWDVRPWYLSKDKIGGILLYTSDITQKKNAMLKLARSEEQFRQTFDNAPIGIALVSPKGEWLKVNPQVCKIVGYSESELLDQSFQDITHTDDLEADLGYVKQVLNGEINYYHLEKRYYHKKGHIVWVLLSVSLIRDEYGNPRHFVTQIKDITSKKKAQQKLEQTLTVVKEQNNRLINFAHIVSHNLRSHSGNLEMLLQFFKDETEEKEKDFLLNSITAISKSLSETITHLTEVVKIQNSTHETKNALNLHAYLEKAINTVQADLIKTKGQVVLEVPSNTEVLFNPAYLDSVLLNFITNALKYRHKERTPVIHITAKPTSEFVVLNITDNGLGIDLQKHGEKLFGLYKTFHHRKDARGVGLFITKNQIEAMGGKVEVESELGCGTTFKIYFPYEKNKVSLRY